MFCSQILAAADSAETVSLIPGIRAMFATARFINRFSQLTAYKKGKHPSLAQDRRPDQLLSGFDSTYSE